MHERLFRPKRGYLSTVRVELYSLQTRMAQATTGPARMKSTMVYGQRLANWGAALIDLAEESLCMRPARLSLLTKLLVWAREKPKLWCALGCYRTLTFARTTIGEPTMQLLKDLAMLTWRYCWPQRCQRAACISISPCNAVTTLWPLARKTYSDRCCPKSPTSHQSMLCFRCKPLSQLKSADGHLGFSYIGDYPIGTRRYLLQPGQAGSAGRTWDGDLSSSQRYIPASYMTSEEAVHSPQER